MFDVLSSDIHELLVLLLYAVIMLASVLFLIWTTAQSWEEKKYSTAVLGGFFMLLGSLSRVLSDLVEKSDPHFQTFWRIVSGDLLSASLATFLCLVIWIRK